MNLCNKYFVIKIDVKNLEHKINILFYISVQMPIFLQLFLGKFYVSCVKVPLMSSG